LSVLRINTAEVILLTAILLLTDIVYSRPDNELISENPPLDRIELSGKWKIQPAEFDSVNFSNPLIDISQWPEIPSSSNWYTQGYNISGKVWYCKSFILPKETRGKSVELCFKGVDYYADVWLNGVFLGSHEGYFQPFNFDISKIIKWDSENRLTVLVNSPKEKPGVDWSLHKRLIKGVFGHHDSRPGGAWSNSGQDGCTGGIWAPVYLHFYNGTKIESAKITYKVDEISGIAILDVEALIINLMNKEQCNLNISVKPDNFTSESGNSYLFRKTINTGDDTSIVRISLPLDNIHLWYPYELGFPHLYKIEHYCPEDFPGMSFNLL